MSRPRFIGGALLAATAAGPIFILLFVFEQILAGSPPHGDFLTGLPLVLLVAAVFGFIPGLVASLAGATVLALLGRRRRWARYPIAWAVAGCVLGWALGIATTAASGIDWHIAQLLAGTLPYALDGILAALVARWRTRWPDGD